MRIISKTHDYYDAALVYGRDDTLIFNRVESTGPAYIIDDIRSAIADRGILQFYSLNRLGVTVPYNAHYAHIPNTVDKGVTFATVRIVFVGFCGVLYPAVMYNAKITSAFDSNEITEISYLTDLSDDAVAAAAKKLAETVIKHTPMFANEFLPNHYSNDKKNGGSYSQQLHNITAKLHQLSNKFSHVFVNNKVPYFVADMYDNSIRFLPSLKDLQFYKVKDPFTAMQELSMYVGGVIPRQEKELFNISDKDRIAQHGFDKLSFRHPFK